LHPETLTAQEERYEKTPAGQKLKALKKFNKENPMAHETTTAIDDKLKAEVLLPGTPGQKLEHDKMTMEEVQQFAESADEKEAEENEAAAEKADDDRDWGEVIDAHKKAIDERDSQDSADADMKAKDKPYDRVELTKQIEEAQKAIDTCMTELHKKCSGVELNMGEFVGDHPSSISDTAAEYDNAEPPTAEELKKEEDEVMTLTMHGPH